MTFEQAAAPRVTPSSPAEPGASFATAFAHRVGALVMIMSVLTCGCGSSSGRASAEYPAQARARPRSDDLDPSKAPNVTSVFNIAALRSGKGTSPLLALFTRTLPAGVAIDDVDWLAVDGPGPLDSPTQNVVFVARPSAALLVIPVARAASRRLLRRLHLDRRRSCASAFARLRRSCASRTSGLPRRSSSWRSSWKHATTVARTYISVSIASMRRRPGTRQQPWTTRSPASTAALDERSRRECCGMRKPRSKATTHASTSLPTPIKSKHWWSSRS